MAHVPSACQLADVLTKGLNSSTFHDLVSKLGDIYPQLERECQDVDIL